MTEVNTVTLNTSSYNQIKAENQKTQMLIDNMLENAYISEDSEKLIFDSDKIVLAMSVLFPERYKKKLAALRTLRIKGKIR